MPEEPGSGQQKKSLRDIGVGAGRKAEAGVSPPSPSPAAGPSAAEQERAALAQRASSLGSRLSSVRSRASMSDLRARLGSLDTTLSNLPAALAEVRQGGYVYKGYLEKKVEVLRQQWQGLRARVDSEAAQQGRVLTQEADLLQQRLSALGPYPQAALLDAWERDLNALEGRVQDAVRAVEGQFEAIANNVSQTEKQLQSIRWLQRQIAEASFRLRPEENIVEAVAAQYLTQGDKEGPKGILYVTDQRLLFEQKEDVATKKFLFIATERKRIQRLLLDVPIGSIERSQAGERGALMFKKELLELHFSQGDVSRALIKIEADSEAWLGLIGRVRSGDIAGERVGGTPPPTQAPAAEIPSKCPTCGAQITVEVVRGMQSITCEYCGTMIRL